MNWSELLKALKSTKIHCDFPIRQIVDDSRSVTPGDVFVSLARDQEEGRRHIEEAVQNGAVGIVHSILSIKIKPPSIHVADVQRAYAMIAASWRRAWGGAVIAVTGSAGKTTTKEMIHLLLGQKLRGVATHMNENNEIGVPRTLLSVQSHDAYAVVEVGARMAGDIAYFGAIIKPDVALVVRCAEAHLETFIDLPTIIREKTKLYDQLSEAGTAILLKGTVYESEMKEVIGQRDCITYGHAGADIYATAVEATVSKTAFTLHTPRGSIDIQLPLLGAHNIENALAAVAVAHHYDVSLPDIKKGLSCLTPMPGRLMKRAGQRGSVLIDDTYNGSPRAVCAAIDLLRTAQGERILVLGDMTELGKHAETVHRQIAQHAKKAGIQSLFLFGESTTHCVPAFGSGAYHFKSQAALIEALQPRLKKDVTCLIKGGNVIKMWHVTEALEEVV